MITPSIIAGFVLGALIGDAGAQPGVEAIRALNLGQWRTAAESLRASLDQHPDDSDLLARLGLAYYQLGLYSDAEAAFRDAGGSVFYESQAIGAHASTLRELGMFDEAAPLRRAQLLSADTDASLNAAFLGAADDAMAAGDLEAALELAEEALALRPASPTAHAWLADIHLRAGDLDAAGYHLWLSELDGYQSSRTRELRVRMAMADDSLVEAMSLIEDSRQGRRRNAGLAVLHAQIYRQIGWLSDAQAVFDRQFVHFGERCDYLLERGQLMLALGQTEAGCQSLDRAAELYPHHTEAHELSVFHQCPGAEGP